MVEISGKSLKFHTFEDCLGKSFIYVDPCRRLEPQVRRDIMGRHHVTQYRSCAQVMVEGEHSIFTRIMRFRASSCMSFPTLFSHRQGHCAYLGF